MSLTFDTDIRSELAHQAASAMITAARTAPKARGKDTITTAIADDETRLAIADHMRTMVAEKRAAAFFLRDADCIAASHSLVLIGTAIDPLRLSPCGLCGFANCEEKDLHPDHPCSFNTGDLGIAIGSAVSAAADSRVDTRIMFSVGMAARDMKLLGDEVKIVYGIPVSIAGKSPFFDRKPKG